MITVFLNGRLPVYTCQNIQPLSKYYFMKPKNSLPLNDPACLGCTSALSAPYRLEIIDNAWDVLFSSIVFRQTKDGDKEYMSNIRYVIADLLSI